MTERGDELPFPEPRRADPPTPKERAHVERAVGRLLDALAPERTVIRAVRPAQPVERYRTPRGCILQAAAAAVTVSWFPDAASDAAFGELQVLAWRGVVSRPGATDRGPGGATIGQALVLRPDGREAPAERHADLGHATDAADAADVAVEWGWRADDDTCYEADALAAHCLALLAQQLAVDVPADESG